MPRLELLAEVQRKMLQMFPCMEHDDTPWTPLSKPLSESRLALVTTAGLHLRGDKPFVSDHRRSDTSYRVIPRVAKTSEMLQSHTSIGFDHAAIYRDINVTFPVDRLQELVDQGVLGSLAENNYSFMGAQRDMSEILNSTAPEVTQRLLEEGVDVVFLTPT